MTESQKAFLKFATDRGYDTAHTYDTERSRWVWLNPMTADLYVAWTASREAALEEAEKLCEWRAHAIDHGGNRYVRSSDAMQCASTIRSLRDADKGKDLKT